MPINAAERAEKLESERAVLVRAESDIQNGWRRLHNQEDLIRELQAGGHDTRQAKRLLELLKDTLAEWERHRILIKQRVAYLEEEC
jgi:hypothetical protein